MNINELLHFMKKNRASDLHLSSGEPPALRIHGEIQSLQVAPLSKEDMISMIYTVMNDKQRAEYEEQMELDFAIQIDEQSRFRVNAFTTIKGPAAVFRDIPTKVLSIEELKLPAILTPLAEKHKGLILVTGPTGSGKSTTLAAMIDHINSTSHKHILTVEDPVEFVHKAKKSVVNQRELGSCTKSFARALKSALREDPDVILVGELRDLETISLAMTAAETGHIVFGTLHTSSAAKTVDRLIDVFPEGDKDMARTMFAGSVEAIISQLLIKRSDGTGRVASHEILIANPAVRNLIRDNKIPQLTSVIQVNSKLGMRLMKDSVTKLLDEGVINEHGARDALNEIGMADEENKPGTSSKATGNSTGGDF